MDFMIAHAALQIFHKLPREVENLSIREKAVILASCQVEKEDRDKQIEEAKHKRRR